MVNIDIRMCSQFLKASKGSILTSVCVYRNKKYPTIILALFMCWFFFQVSNYHSRSLHVLLFFQVSNYHSRSLHVLVFFSTIQLSFSLYMCWVFFLTIQLSFSLSFHVLFFLLNIQLSLSLYARFYLQSRVNFLPS